MKTSAVNTSEPSVYNVDKMCLVVGELTDQIHQLMRKMRATVKQREIIYKKKLAYFERQPVACDCDDDDD